MNASERFHTEWRDYYRGLHIVPPEQPAFRDLAAAVVRAPPPVLDLSWTSCAFFAMLLRQEIEIERLRTALATREG